MPQLVYEDQHAEHEDTDYDIEVVTSYKGDAADTVNLRLMGGIEGAFIEEQKAALKEKADEGIPLVEKRPDLALGQTYLFVLYQYENAIPTLVNPDQGAFSIDDPLAKDVFSYVSAKEIISFFGEDKWGSSYGCCLRDGRLLETLYGSCPAQTAVRAGFSEINK